MWWPYRFRDATGGADPAARVRAFAAAVAGAGDAWVEATGRAEDGALDVWFRCPGAPSESGAWDEALRASGLVAERLKGRN
jgi:hypothetical protein